MALSGGCMKRKIRFLLIAAVTLIAILGGCDTGNGDNLSVPPITFTGTWVDPTWFDGPVIDRPNSRFNIFMHVPGQKIDGAVMNMITGGAITTDLPYPVPRRLTVNPDWTFTYTGGFGQNPISIGPVTLYPRIVVKGTISYAEGQFFTITPTSGTIDLTDLEVLNAGENINLPPETVASFEEYASISKAGGRLIIDDMPQTVTNAKGILRGIWTKQP
jgi:hypothetical protein